MAFYYYYYYYSSPEDTIFIIVKGCPLLLQLQWQGRHTLLSPVHPPSCPPSCYCCHHRAYSAGAVPSSVPGRADDSDGRGGRDAALLERVSGPQGATGAGGLGDNHDPHHHQIGWLGGGLGSMIWDGKCGGHGTASVKDDPESDADG